MMEVVSGDSWSYRMCKAPVKSSSPTNQRQFILRRFAVATNAHLVDSCEKKRFCFSVKTCVMDDSPEMLIDILSLMTQRVSGL